MLLELMLQVKKLEMLLELMLLVKKVTTQGLQKLLMLQETPLLASILLWKC